MRFDWYQATVSESPIVLVETVAKELGAASIEAGKGRHNYHQSFTLRSASGDRLAAVLAGGPNGDPNITASGEITPRFVEVIRGHWPRHNVTRFDSCEDFAEEGAFNELERACRAVAAAAGVKGRSIVPDDAGDGRTYYMGAPTSDVRARLYDKAAELRRSVAPDKHDTIPAHLSRLEVQARPRREFKTFACVFPPEMVWGLAGWTHQLYEGVFKLSLERVNMYVSKETDYERSYRFMLMQYAKVLQRQFGDLGSWSAVGLQLGEDLAKLAKRP
jgi:hypothetical protein